MNKELIWKEYLSRIFELVTDGLEVVGLDGRIVYTNSRAEQILGVGKGEAIGRPHSDPIWEITTQEGKPFPMQLLPFPQVIRTRSSVSGTILKLKRPDGSVVLISACAAPVEDSEGNLTAVIIALSDITEQTLGVQLAKALNHINTVINSTLDFNEIMRRVVVEAQRAIGCETVCVLLRERDLWIPKYVYGWGEKLGAGLSIDEATALSMFAQGNQPVVVNDASTNELIDASVVGLYKISSIMLVPLVERGKVVGAMAFVYHSAPIGFDEMQVDFGGKLGSAVSLAMENATLYESSHRIAEILQESLIRPVPAIPKLDIGVVYESAYEAEKVGGDFFDVFELDDQRVCLLVGDVAGKGVEAAGLTETVRSSVRTLAYMNCDPGLLLSQANLSLLRQVPATQYATAILIVLDMASDEMIVANAGHPPAVIRGKEQGFLTATVGPPLGVIPHHYEETRLRFSQDDVLLLYTDGLIEARRGPDLFGEQRLLRTMHSISAIKPQLIVESLLESVTDFSKGKLTDDLIILAVRKLA